MASLMSLNVCTCFGIAFFKVINILNSPLDLWRFTQKTSTNSRSLVYLGVHFTDFDPHSMRLHDNSYSRSPSWCWSRCHSCLHCSCWVTILMQSRMARSHITSASHVKSDEDSSDTIMEKRHHTGGRSTERYWYRNPRCILSNTYSCERFRAYANADQSLVSYVNKGWEIGHLLVRMRNLYRSKTHPGSSKFTRGCFHTWCRLVLAWLHLFNRTIKISMALGPGCVFADYAQ